MRSKHGFILIENMVALAVFAVFVGTFISVFGVYSRLYQQALEFQTMLTSAQNGLDLCRDGQASSDLKLKVESGSEGITKATYVLDAHHLVELWIK